MPYHIRVTVKIGFLLTPAPWFNSERFSPVDKMDWPSCYVSKIVRFRGSLSKLYPCVSVSVDMSA